MRLYLRLAWQNIWRNKRRTLITVSSIFFAVLLALFSRSMQRGSYGNIIGNVVKFYCGHAQVQHPDYWDNKTLDNSLAYSPEAVRQAAENPHIRLITPRLQSFALASSGKQTRGVVVIGVQPAEENQLSELSKRLIAGDYLDSLGAGVLVAEGLAGYLKLIPGDTLVLIGQGYHGASAAGLFPVIGIVKFPLPELNRSLIYLNLTAAQQLYAADNRITSYIILADKEAYLPQITAHLRQIFGAAGAILSWREMAPELVQALELDSAFGLIMIGILYAVIGFGIFGTVMMMTAERRHEFGMLIAMGLRRERLIGIVLIETLFLTALGALSGIIGGIPMLLFLHWHPLRLTGDAARAVIEYGFEPVIPFSLDPRIFIGQTLVIAVLSLITGIYPLATILRLKVVEAMRS